MERVRQFFSAVLAGGMIGVGGISYLSCDNKYIGSFLFSIGLLTILIFQLGLYTGKVGYILNNKPKYLIEVLITGVGNFVGTYLIATAIINTRVYGNLSKVNDMANLKLNDSVLSIFLLAILCGLLMFIAVDTYNNNKNIIGVSAVLLCVAVFILSGFEHSIANMFYFNLSQRLDAHSMIYILIMMLGNLVGGNLIPLYQKTLTNKGFCKP